MEDVKKVCLSCQVCAVLKPRFCKPPQNSLIKAIQSFERLAIDFKGPLPSSFRNIYILVIVDEFSRFPFCFPCHNMSSQTVINCLDHLFTLCGIPMCIHSDNAGSLHLSLQNLNGIWSTGKLLEATVQYITWMATPKYNDAMVVFGVL